MLGLKAVCSQPAQNALRAFSSNSNVNSLSSCTWALSSETDELQMAVTDLILSGRFPEWCRRNSAHKTNWQGRKMFLQSSYKEGIISSMAWQVFLLDLVLMRKMVCGSSVESVLPDFSMLFTPGIIRRCWLVMAGLVSAPILPHLSLFAWCGEQWNWENSVCFGARSDNLWWVSYVICLTGQCSMGAVANE